MASFMCRCFDDYRGACSLVEGAVRPNVTHRRSAKDRVPEQRGLA
jgi:hypothetical protein